MPFLVWHLSLGSSSVDRPCPQEASLSWLAWLATSQKCPPITSCPSITSTTCTEPEVSRTQLRAPPAFLSYLAKKSLPPDPRYSAPLASATDIPHERRSATARQEASWLPWRSNLTRALAALPPTASHAHAAQMVVRRARGRGSSATARQGTG